MMPPLMQQQGTRMNKTSRHGGSRPADPAASAGSPGLPITPASADPHPDPLAAQARLLELVPLLKAAAGLVIAAVVIAALYFGKNILIPIALAALLGFLLDPLVNRLRRWGLPRMLAVAIVTLATLVMLIGIGTYMFSQLRGLSADLPGYQDTIRQKLLDLREQVRAPSAWDGALSTFDVVKREIIVAEDDEGTAGSRRGEPMPVVIASSELGPAQTALAWMARIGSPAATAGIVALFVVLMLLNREALRDRLLRLTGGGDLHRATDALQEAGNRIGNYLRMQLVVNVTYGVPLALGLYLIGVPGAFLWGLLAVLLRFLPYVGPLISSLFPLVLAFAVDPGWSMVLWTLALIASLELISNNIIEPWLYGASTGMSALTIIVAAMFWTTLWGPIGLILSTPITVCLLVLGRYLPGMGFFEALLGSEPVLDAPNRLYQRLLAGDVIEATELATRHIDDTLEEQGGESATAIAEAVTAFYDTVAIPSLRIASAAHAGTATARHRLQLTTGMQELLEELREDLPPPAPSSETIDPAGPKVVCLAARWEMDAMGARMVEHALRLHGIDAHAVVSADVRGSGLTAVAEPGPDDVVCISVFHPEPQALIRLIVRQLRRRGIRTRIIVMPWSLTGRLGETTTSGLASVSWAGSITELAQRLLFEHTRKQPTPSNDPAADASTPARTTEPGNHGLAVPALRAMHLQTIRHVANAFDIDYAQISLADGGDLVVTASTLFPESDPAEEAVRVPLPETACRLVIESDRALVIQDTDRDPRVASLPAFVDHKIRFYAGVPLRLPKGQVIGSLCVMDDQPRELDADELALLQTLADKLVRESLEQAGPRRRSTTAPAAE